MIDIKSKPLQNMPVEAIEELKGLLEPSLDILNTLGEVGFSDPYEGWDYTGSLTDAMALIYLRGVMDGFKDCNDCWNETVNDSEFILQKLGELNERQESSNGK